LIRTQVRRGALGKKQDLIHVEPPRRDKKKTLNHKAKPSRAENYEKGNKSI